jgi:3-oxoadipate enol-lactonase
MAAGVISGLNVAYQLEGPIGAPVLMFGNGLATAMAMWQPQAEHLTGRYRVLRYDIRGHGGTAASPAPYTLEQLADDAAALLEFLGIGRAAYVGLSLGGEIGQVLAVRHAARVERLVLCDTTLRNRRSMWTARIAAVEAEGLEPQLEPAMERWFTPRFRLGHPALVEAMRRMVRATSVEGYLGCAMAMRDARLEPLAGRISQPALVVTGEKDLSTPPDEAGLLHRAIAGSQLAVIEDAAHLPNIEQETRFNALIDEFLATQAEPPCPTTP